MRPILVTEPSGNFHSMSYLTSASGPEFNKAIISFWFKVPQKSLDKAKKDSDASKEENKFFDGIVPLVVMGKEGVGDEPTKTEETDGVLTFTGGSGTLCSGGLIDTIVECTSSGPGGICCLTSLITFIYDCDCISTVQ